LKIANGNNIPAILLDLARQAEDKAGGCTVEGEAGEYQEAASMLVSASRALIRAENAVLNSLIQHQDLSTSKRHVTALQAIYRAAVNNGDNVSGSFLEETAGGALVGAQKEDK